MKRVQLDKSTRMARRQFLKSAGGVSVAVVTSSTLSGCDEGEPTARAFSPPRGIVRDFADPYLELIRLLREAAEIEHDLMIQYLFAAFSLKPAYEDLAGFAMAEPHSLLGVAIQEMQHLAGVNHLLRELGHRPVLERADFPFENDLYPFTFELEPMSRLSLAKYTYCEAPEVAFTQDPDSTPGHTKFLIDIRETLGHSVRINHVGTLYMEVLARLQELSQQDDKPDIDYIGWREKLLHIAEEGEVDHYNFFRSLFMANHPALRKNTQIWSLPVDHERYPSRLISGDHTAYVGQPNTIPDETARELAWLGNLTYWATLILLSIAYETDNIYHPAIAHSKNLMIGPLWSLGRVLPDYGYGLPFDRLSMHYNPGGNVDHAKTIVVRLLTEAEQKARAMDPVTFPVEMDRNVFTLYKNLIIESEF